LAHPCPDATPPHGGPPRAPPTTRDIQTCCLVLVGSPVTASRALTTLDKPVKADDILPVNTRVRAALRAVHAPPTLTRPPPPVNVASAADCMGRHPCINGHGTGLSLFIQPSGRTPRTYTLLLQQRTRTPTSPLSVWAPSPPAPYVGDHPYRAAHGAVPGPLASARHRRERTLKPAACLFEPAHYAHGLRARRHCLPPHPGISLRTLLATLRTYTYSAASTLMRVYRPPSLAPHCRTVYHKRTFHSRLTQTPVPAQTRFLSLRRHTTPGAGYPTFA